MELRLFFSLSAAALAAATLLACTTTPQSGTDIGNGIVAVQVDLQGYDGRAVPRRLDLASGDRIDEAMIAVEKIRLRPGETCGDEEGEEEEEDDDELDVEGPILADLAGEGVVGGPLGFDVEGGSFCELRLDLHAGELLEGASVVLRGARADGVPFEVRSEISESLELRSGDAPFSLTEGDAALVLAFDLAAWIEALDLASLAADPGGTIRIAEDSGDEALEDALDRFEEAVKASAELVRDEDGDADLDDDEDAIAD